MALPNRNKYRIVQANTKKKKRKKVPLICWLGVGFQESKVLDKNTEQKAKEKKINRIIVKNEIYISL